MTKKCESCACNPQPKINNTDLNDLLQKAIEAQPTFVKPLEIIRINTRTNKKTTSFWGKWFK